jgi:TRAP-type mannitol/chloroaromatic compound transport system substrate-binding protein
MKKMSGIIVGVVIAVFMTMTMFTATAMAEIIKWRAVSCWPAYSSMGIGSNRLANTIYELSGGRLRITVHPAGELVPAAAVFDTVSKGAAEIGVDFPGYWAGKNSAFDLLGSFPMTLSQYDVINWYIHGEGRDIFNYMYGKYNMLYFINGVTPVGSGIRSRMPIKSLADLKGKKIRMAGKAAGYILQKAGAVPVMLQASEMAQALAAGTVDGASFNIPSADWSLGLGEVTKYNIGPAWNMPSATGGVMVNKDAWDALPPDLKKILEVALSESNLYYTSLSDVDNSSYDPNQKTTSYIAKFKEKGTIVSKWSDKDLKQIEEWTWEFIVEEAKKNPDYDKVATSMFQFLKDYREMREYQVPFAHGRTPTTFPKLPNLK